MFSFFKGEGFPRKSASVFFLVFIVLAGIIAVQVYATESMQMDRPGAKAEEDASLYGAPVDYPDLGFCSQLQDDAIYRGKHRILKYIYPGKDGWLFRSADFRTDFTLPPLTLDYMKDVNSRLKDKGVDLVVILQPPRAVMMKDFIDPENMPEGYDPSVAKRNYKDLIALLNREGIRAVDLSEAPSDMPYFFKGDPHWRREGAMWSAEQVAKIVRQNPKYDGIKKEEFSIEITWWLESEKGEFDEFVEKACDVTIPPERRPMWATTSLSGDITEDSLFGDVTYPDIAIVGTSNTAHEEDFNFAGSLKQVLHADIRNRALSAGAFSGASLVFYATDEFHEHPPKILLWEFLSHHIFDDYLGFRQMLPAINGACSADDALAEAELKVSKTPLGMWDKNLSEDDSANGPVPQNRGQDKKKTEFYETVVFDNLDLKKIPGKGSFLYLEVTNPETRLLKAGILYANGDAEEVDLSRSLRVDNNGKYYLLFNPDIDQDLLMIQIETEKLQGDIKARICKDSL